ncbi:hypothetical protein ARMGADRAFT_1034229 [Armillaria gallica]|uniref:Uncharacterized protein n=1 Tax=Armillaria gallica TaxID=47427 RepID=A0A2H3CZ43_ARMGA|nr:hypothetical protein ARMGADRAFT_1034229 [Armillaria gallica]
MSIIPSPTMKKIRLCFFVSLAFLIVIPITCIVLGVTLHPTEFEYIPRDPSVNRIISLHADLISADVMQGSMVLQWSIADDSCAVEGCSDVNIYFDSNLLHSGAENSGPADNNRPVNPTFVWNVTAGYEDDLARVPTFQTQLAVIPPSGDYSKKHLVRDTHLSEVYYPFDRYLTVIFGFAEDATIVRAQLGSALEAWARLEQAQACQIVSPSLEPKPVKAQARLRLRPRLVYTKVKAVFAEGASCRETEY